MDDRDELVWLANTLVDSEISIEEKRTWLVQYMIKAGISETSSDAALNDALRRLIDSLSGRKERRALLLVLSTIAFTVHDVQ